MLSTIFTKKCGEMTKLSQSTIEALDYYVYLLIDPRNNKTFYVGKGHGNRINQHLLGALETELDEIEKIKTIHEIQKAGFEVRHLILRHGLTEKEAFEVESSIIDFIGMENLTNIVAGHYASERGLMSLEDIAIKYQAEDAVFEESALLININRRYHYKITPEEIYNATKGNWIVSSERVKNINVICSVYAGIIREVFIPTSWNKSQEAGRLCFEGKIAPDSIRNKYINKSVAKYWKQGSQNPVKYVDICP